MTVFWQSVAKWCGFCLCAFYGEEGSIAFIRFSRWSGTALDKYVVWNCFVSCPKSLVPGFLLQFPYPEVQESIVLGNSLDCGRKGLSPGPESVLTRLRWSTMLGLESGRRVRLWVGEQLWALLAGLLQRTKGVAIVSSWLEGIEKYYFFILNSLVIWFC